MSLNTTDPAAVNPATADAFPDIPAAFVRQAGGKAFHPLASIFPLIDGKDFEELVDSIKASGLREPITLHEGKIIDGRNRARACETAGVPPIYVNLPDDVDPVRFVIDKNIHRRHLTATERSMVAAKIANMVVGGKEANSANLQDCPPVSRAAAAKMLNVSERSVASATKVLAEGAPELVQAIEQHKVTVSAGAEVATLPPDKQRDAVERNSVAAVARRIREQAKQREKRKRAKPAKAAPPVYAAYEGCSPEEMDLIRLQEAWEVACSGARGRFLGEIKFDEFFEALQHAPALKAEIDRRVRGLEEGNKKSKDKASANTSAPSPSLKKALDLNDDVQATAP
jgi:ParB-like chromosome segregation protein Spo0J